MCRWTFVACCLPLAPRLPPLARPLPSSSPVPPQSVCFPTNPGSSFPIPKPQEQLLVSVFRKVIVCCFIFSLTLLLYFKKTHSLCFLSSSFLILIFFSFKKTKQNKQTSIVSLKFGQFIIGTIERSNWGELRSCVCLAAVSEQRDDPSDAGGHLRSRDLL